MLKAKSLREFISYCTIGVLNTAVHYVVFRGLLTIVSLQTIANTLGFCCGLVVSFFLNSRFTFKTKVSFFRCFKLGLASGAVALVFGALGDILALHPTLTFVSYVLVNPVIGFLLAKYFVFR